MSAKEVREDAVLESFVRHLSDAGLTAALIERPDRVAASSRRYAALTSDGLIRVNTPVGPQEWSCDVMALAAPSSHAQLPDFLHQDLDGVAANHAVHIHVTGSISGLPALKTLTAAVAREVESGAGTSVVHPELIATWIPAEPGLVTLLLELPSPSAVLSDQIADTISKPLAAKATKQAAPAKQAGIRAAVLLDGVGPAGMLQGTHWLHQSANTVGVAVEQVLADCPSILDAVYYLHPDGTWHCVYGSACADDPLTP